MRALPLPNILERRWSGCWTALKLTPPPAALGQLLAAWSEPHRHYHTLQHLEECLGVLDAASACHEPRWAEIELALYFHDAIYLTRRHDNEQRSADWAETVLAAAGALPPLRARIRSLVLATRHDATPESLDAQWLVDIDLAILGAEPVRFVAYEAAIRREYDWVESTVFVRERVRILQGFLQRPRIYCTGQAFAWFEHRARDNLQRSLCTLMGES